jgi:hypothetical protein
MKASFCRNALALALGIILVSVAGPVSAEVTIKRVPMSEQQAHITDGPGLYGELCAVCHGQDATGDGPAISALDAVPPDLTVLALTNDGAFPREEVETTIAGRHRDENELFACGMPSWYRAFSGVHPTWSLARRHNFAMSQVGRLTDYLEAIQIDYSHYPQAESTGQ